MSHCFSKSDIFYSEYFAYGRSSITIWAVPLTLITWVGLSHLPICYYLDLPTHPNYTGWALSSTYLLLSGPSRSPKLHWLGSPIYLSTTIWAFPLTQITLAGLSCLPIYYYLGSPIYLQWLKKVSQCLWLFM
jgi:hypothetical protein